MTQLFDTNEYENAADSSEPTAGVRHLQAVPSPQVVWALDADTIETGRKGLARARQALRSTPRPDSRPGRAAA